METIICFVLFFGVFFGHIFLVNQIQYGNANDIDPNQILTWVYIKKKRLSFQDMCQIHGELIVHFPS